MSKTKKRPAKEETYCAFYGDGTVKIGFCHHVMSRIRSLGGSSSCFVVLTASHSSETKARESETQMKKDLKKFLIKEAECQEWLNPKVRGFFPTLQRSIKEQMGKRFKYAFAVGQKVDTDWETGIPENVKKIVTGK